MISVKIVIHFLCLCKYYFGVFLNPRYITSISAFPSSTYQFLTVKVLTNFTTAAYQEI